MAESVDALVSNTNDSNVVPVRPRLRVLERKDKTLLIGALSFLIFPSRPHRDRKSAFFSENFGFFDFKDRLIRLSVALLEAEPLWLLITASFEFLHGK